jgi:hypothetical protein
VSSVEDAEDTRSLVITFGSTWVISTTGAEDLTEVAATASGSGSGSASDVGGIEDRGGAAGLDCPHHRDNGLEPDKDIFGDILSLFCRSVPRLLRSS